MLWSTARRRGSGSALVILFSILPPASPNGADWARSLKLRLTPELSSRAIKYCLVGAAAQLPTVTDLSAILGEVPGAQFLGGFHHERKSEPLHHEHKLISRRPNCRPDDHRRGRLARRPAGAPGRGRFLRQRTGGRDRVSGFAPDRGGAARADHDRSDVCAIPHPEERLRTAHCHGARIGSHRRHL